jgi:hypothetical protein
MDRSVLDKRFNQLKNDASGWITAWKDLARFIRPHRGVFDDQPNVVKSIDNKVILSNHAGRAARTLAAGLNSGLTSPSRPWFKLGLPDTDLMKFEPVKIWLDRVQQLMLAIFARSNMYLGFHSVYEDISTFATAAAIIEEDFNNVIRCQNFAVGEFYLGTGADGRVNTLARRFYKTVGQLVEEFGEDKISATVKAMYDSNNLDKWVIVRHIIEPNDDRVADSALSKDLPFRSCYWEEGIDDNSFLRLSGYHEFPVIAPRWDVTSQSFAYGYGPSWEALSDVKMFHTMKRDQIIAIEKVINPPVVQDASTKGNSNTTIPGGISYSTSNGTANAGVRPAYQINPDFRSIIEAINETKEDISDTFFNDLFRMLQFSDANMTAREVAERHEEKLLMLGPVIERFKTELHDPVIDRTFAIALRAGILPEPPQELQGMDINIEYISILAQAQKMVGTRTIEQTASFVGNLAAAKPEVLDKFDFDEAVDQYANMMGTPAKIVRSPEAVSKIRQERAKQQQQAALAQNAASVVQGAKVLADTKLGENSALDAVISGVGGGNAQQ